MGVSFTRGVKSSAVSWARISCAATVVAALALSGCSTGKKDDSAQAATTAAVTKSATVGSTTSSSGASTAAADHAGGFHLHDGYVKAAKKGGMTSVFGVLENHGDKPVHLVGFTSNVSAKMYQIHEVVGGTMQQKKDGITIGSGKTLELKPGGYHLMLMGLTEDVPAGSTIDVTLRFADGNTVRVAGLPVRQMAAGSENYAGGDGEAMTSGMSMPSAGHGEGMSPAMPMPSPGHGESMSPAMPMPASGGSQANHGAMPMTGVQTPATAAQK